MAVYRIIAKCKAPGILLLLLLTQAGTAAAQNRVQIVRADSIVGTNTPGKTMQRVIGNVHLRTEEMDMYADSAYRYRNRELVRAFGNIEINTPQENIWADTLTYYTDIDFAELRGRVIIESDSTTLFGHSVDYRFTNKVAHFRDKIRLQDQQGVLTANSGFYFRRADSATFRGQVQLRDSLQYIEGDSLFTNRQKGYYELHGRVYANDPENNSRLKADYLEADSTGRRLLKGNAWLINYEEDTTRTDSLAGDTVQAKPADPPAPPVFLPDSALGRTDSLWARPDTLRPAAADSSRTAGADTTHIRAEHILSLRHRSPTDTSTTVDAYHNVRIWSPDFSAVADTARYESKAQTFELWSNAIAWHEQIQLTGPYIWVKLDDGEIQKLISYPNPFTVQQDTVINRLNQIKGDTLSATFAEGNLQLIRVYRQSHLLRFTRQDDQPDGVLELRAPETRIYFENGSLVELKSLGRQELVKGNYLPESPDIAEKKLEGFSWNPDRRPQRPSRSMEPRFPPIPETPPFELPRRYLQHVEGAGTAPAPTRIEAAPADSTRAGNTQ